MFFSETCTHDSSAYEFKKYIELRLIRVELQL